MKMAVDQRCARTLSGGGADEYVHPGHPGAIGTSATRFSIERCLLQVCAVRKPLCAG